MEKIIEVCDLSIPPVFSHFSLAVEKGLFTVLTGPNRSGKTLLLKVFAGIIATQGSVLLEGCPFEKTDSFKRYQELAVIFSSQDSIFAFERVEEGLKFVLSSLKITEEEASFRFQKVVKRLSLSSLLTLSPKHLSRLQKKKLSLALALLTEPKLLLLDDPCRALDSNETNAFLSDLLSLKEEGMTILMTSDNLNDCLKADRMVVLNQGKNVLDGTPLEVFREDGVLNRIGLRLPFLVDLSVKLQYYNLVDTIYLDEEKLVDAVWKSE